jgi:hypothetical protein
MFALADVLTVNIPIGQTHQQDKEEAEFEKVSHVSV